MFRWYSKQFIPGSDNLMSDSINLDLSIYNSSQVIPDTFDVLNRGSIHEVSLLLQDDPNPYYLLKSGKHFRRSNAPDVIRIRANHPIATGTNLGNPFKFDNTNISSSYVSFDTNKDIVIRLKDAVGDYSDGHHFIHTNDVLTYINGRYLKIDPWSFYISKSIDSYDSFDCCINNFVGNIKLYRKTISSDNLVKSLHEFTIGDVKVISYRYIPSDSNIGWLYILYSNNESLTLKATEPSNSAFITNSTNHLSIVFSKPIIDPGDINNRLSVSDTGGLTFYTGDSYTLYNNQSATVSLPSIVNNEGLHYVKFNGSNIYSKDGDFFNPNSTTFYGSYFRVSNKLGNLENVNDTGTIQPSGNYTGLITDGINWFRGVIGGSSSTNTGSGAPTDASYVVLNSNATLSNERILSMGTGLNMIDLSTGLTINFNTGILSGFARTSQIITSHSGLSDLTSDDHVRYLYLLPNDSARNIVGIQDPAVVGMAIQEANSQTANSIEIIDNGANVIAHIEAGGKIFGNGLDANNKQVENVGNPTALTDAINLGYFTGNIIASTGISVTSTAGQVFISSTGSSGGAPIDGGYLVITNTPSLANERAIAMGTGLTAVDGGANSSYTINLNTGIITGNITTGNFRSYIVPNYAVPVHIYGSSTTTLAANASQGISLGNSSTVIRAPLMAGEILVAVRSAVRFNAGTSPGSYRVTGGLRYYPNLVGGSGTIDYPGSTATSTENNNGQGISTGYSYLNPIFVMTGAANVSFNLFLAAANNPAALGATGHTVTIQGWIINTGIPGNTYP